LLSRREGNFPALDGLRAIAALLIVCFHCYIWSPFIVPFASLPPWVRRLWFNGWVGVDIFFVLSGFLIARMLFNQLASGAIRFKAFYIRRSFRIFPAYYVVLTASVFFFARLNSYRTVYENTPWKVVLHRSWANYLYLSNYLYGGKVPNALNWGWSLCIEEHFYLLLPAFLALLFRFTRSWGRVVGLAIVTLLPLAARCVVFAHDPRTVVNYWVYPASHTHFDGLLCGVLLAYGYVYHGEVLRRLVAHLGAFVGIAGFGCLAATLWWGGLFTPGFFPVVLQFLVLAVGATMLLMNGLFLGNRLTRFLAHPAWYPLARVSYGIYLIHVFLLIGVLQWWPRGRYGTWGALASLLGFTAVVTLLTTLCAALLFLILERPLLDWGTRLSRRYGPEVPPRGRTQRPTPHAGRSANVGAAYQP
jgi:peptidoglycan/LPS O-acetylase OafA/YrhL